MFFSVISKNLNWEILTKKSVTLKEEMELKRKNFNIIKGSLKNPIFRGVAPEKPICRGELPKKGGLGQFADLRRSGLGKKIGGRCF